MAVIDWCSENGEGEVLVGTPTDEEGGGCGYSDGWRRG